MEELVDAFLVLARHPDIPLDRDEVDVAACGRGDTDQVACRGDVHVLDTGCRGQSVGDGLGRDTGDGRADAAHARDPQR